MSRRLEHSVRHYRSAIPSLAIRGVYARALHCVPSGLGECCAERRGVSIEYKSRE